MRTLFAELRHGRASGEAFEGEIMILETGEKEVRIIGSNGGLKLIAVSWLPQLTG